MLAYNNQEKAPHSNFLLDFKKRRAVSTYSCIRQRAVHS